MANVIKTVLTYQLDGSNRDFNIPFEYLARKFVVVTLIGVDRKVLTINTDYRFATRTTISLTKAWGPADGYTTIELRRVTSTTDRLVDFTDGSILRAYDLNVAQIQTMHVAEEARDLTADTIGVNNDGHLDARGRRIVNLANAVDDRDAVPFGQLKTMNQNSWQARNEALQFRNEAETFRNQAEGFKNESGTNAANTKQWRDETKGFRDEAEQFKNTAGQYATSAGNSASAAANSQNAAAQSASAAGNSQVAAAQSATSAKQSADAALIALESTGNVPVGTIMMITHNVIPPGWVRCGAPFDVNTYPALAALYPSGVTPTFDHRFPYGTSANGTGDSVGLGAYGDESLPAHSHGFSVSVSGGTAAGGAYSGWTAEGGWHEHDVVLPIQNATGAYTGRLVGGGGPINYPEDWTFKANGGGVHSHSFYVPEHAHTVTASGSGTTNAGGGLGAGQRVLPLHTGVIFIIKAAQGVDDKDAAMQVVGTVVGRVDALEAWYKKSMHSVESTAAYNLNTGLAWDKGVYVRNSSVGLNRMAVLAGSSWGELVAVMQQSGQLLGSPGRLVFDIAIEVTDSSPLFPHNIYFGFAFATVAMNNGTNGRDPIPIPVTFAGHAMNSWQLRMQLRETPGSQGGSPVIEWGFFNTGGGGPTIDMVVNAKVRVRPRMVIG